MNTLRKKVTHHQCPRQSSSTRLIRPPASCLPLNCRSHNLGLQVPRYLLAPAEEQQQHAAHQLMSSSEMSLPCPALRCSALWPWPLPFGLALGQVRPRSRLEWPRSGCAATTAATDRETESLAVE
ncbi:hypothetical protein KC19_7G006500 [Ceratodon purpureus]|uniref:Uncharacterized protein n=1 Tax=Ceratodon purpureus TaxID=3225 RepID=A0A8T0H5W6_CERPU|nr:hypothetical protein KC19_7G006500 [Ceratodon purpureus]